MVSWVEAMSADYRLIDVLWLEERRYPIREGGTVSSPNASTAGAKALYTCQSLYFRFHAAWAPTSIDYVFNLTGVFHAEVVSSLGDMIGVEWPTATGESFKTHRDLSIPSYICSSLMKFPGLTNALYMTNTDNLKSIIHKILWLKQIMAN